MNTNYIALGTERIGHVESPPTSSSAACMTLLIIEYARKRHMPLFILNIILVLYAVYGYVVPGMFYHAGLSWTAWSPRERRNGNRNLFPPAADRAHRDRLVPLVLSLLRGFGCVDSLLARDQARRHPLAARHPAVGGDWLDGDRHGVGLRRRQFDHRRLGDDSRR